MPSNFSRYPVGLILKTAMYEYQITGYHYVEKYLIGYHVKNLGTGRTYTVGTSRVHSKRFKIVDPVAELLYGDKNDS